MKTCIVNGRVLTPFRVIDGGSVIVEEKKITQILAGRPSGCGQEYNIIDAQGMYVSPGFIDLHVHGGGHAEISDGTVGAVQTVCRTHAKYGTTSIVPSVSTAPWPVIYGAIDAVRNAKATNETGAHILGIHIEGPYFSNKERGAQNPDHLLKPHPDEYVKLLDYWDEIVIMSASPEVSGALELGCELRDRGILASIGHSNANYQDVVLALENGYTHITHFYSGCSIVHRENAYRIAGIVESGYLLDELTVEAIADGNHLPPSLLKLIYKVKGPDRIALITDGTSFSGVELTDNQVVQRKDGRKMLLEDGVMKLMDRQSFAGSIATTNSLVRNMITMADVPLLSAVKMASYTPSKILKVSNRKGTLSPGKDADIVVFDDNINIKLTMVEGSVVYSDNEYFNFDN